MVAFTTAKSSYCMNGAAASTSMRNIEIMDTVLQAVSILRISNIYDLNT